MKYQVLSPWAESVAGSAPKIGLQPRPEKLNGKRIGLFGFFKKHSVVVLDEIESSLKERYPDLEFSIFQYPKELMVISDDPEYAESFREWIDKLDAVIGAFGDGGSSSMFLSKNVAVAEKMGKPAVAVTEPSCVISCKAGASTQNVPGLRLALMHIDFDLSRRIPVEELGEVIQPNIAAAIDGIVEGLTRPLSEEEQYPANIEITTSGCVFRGDLEEVNDYFYERGWSYGNIIVPPTQEAVNRMLEGTDLPPDYVVATIPPMHGKATVEKIAVNAVMAGCLPTHMPVIIAGVKAMVNPQVRIEGYTCSAASWFPLWVINGPIRKDLNINCGPALMSPYFKPNVAIANALGLITMNIGGVRCGLEDRSQIGHEGRIGVCFGEDEEASPWEPLHQYYGFQKEDSTITNMWPNARQKIGRGDEDVIEILRNICDKIECVVFDPGSAIIIGPCVAKKLADAGFSRTNVLDYIVEYARRPQPQANPKYIIENNHINPNGPILTMDPTRSCRKFWSKDHLMLVVASTGGIASYAGGGDHGGPISQKIELPKNWKKLTEKYKAPIHNYPRY